MATTSNDPSRRRHTEWLASIPIVAMLLSPFQGVSAASAALSVAGPGTPGSTITVVGNNFTARDWVQLTWDGSTQAMPVVRVTSPGSFSSSATIPAATTIGDHLLAAIGAKNNRTVTASGTSETLASITVVVSAAGSSPGPTSTPSSTPSATQSPTPTPTPTSSATPPPTLSATQESAVVLGAYIPGAPSDPSRIDAYAQLTGTMPHIVMWYQEWSGQWNSFYAKGADAIRARGAMPLISWEPWGVAINDPLWSLKTIVNGSHDVYIHQWTREVASWGYPIYVRPMYEMNGNWTSWSPGVNGNTAAEFITAWRHIVDIARTEGATNIRWVWSPNVDDGNPLLTPYANLYPGDAYVDWTGLDGYNTGSLPGNGWQSLREVFQPSYDTITRLSPRPLMIAETASTEFGGDKAAWITNGFMTDLPAVMPSVRAVVWFDANKETDWRVDSSPQSLDAFQAVTRLNAFGSVLP